MTGTNVLQLLPEIVLATAAIVIFMGGAFADWPRLWRWLAVGAIVLAGVALETTVTVGVPALAGNGVINEKHEPPEGGTPTDRAAPVGVPALAGNGVINEEQQPPDGGTPTADSVLSSQENLVADPLARDGRWLSLAAGVLLVLMAWDSTGTDQPAEYFGTILLLIAGLMLTAGAGDLVLLFVGLELVSIPTYILLYLGRGDVQSQESAVKYFYLSILSSALFLYGLSFLYGLAGRTDLHAIHSRVAGAVDGGFAPLAHAALILILAGLGFRIAAVPFHFYAPDVYQGTTHANAGLLAVAPKIAGLLALVRLSAAALPGLQGYGWVVVMILAILTMTLGNVTALWQNNLRRLLAYSSIAHAGYMLIGLAVYLATEPGRGADGTESRDCSPTWWSMQWPRSVRLLRWPLLAGGIARSRRWTTCRGSSGQRARSARYWPRRSRFLCSVSLESLRLPGSGVNWPSSVVP